MKIFIGHDMFTGTDTVKIQIGDRYIAFTEGERCTDHMPILGVKFDEDKARLLIRWIEVNFIKTKEQSK